MKELENEFIRFWVTDGILYSKFKCELNMDLDKTKRLIELRHTISNNLNQYWCYNLSKLKSFPKECRDYSDIYGQDFLYACAININSHIAKFIFNAYMKLKDPNVLIQAFVSEEKAVEWLLSIKEKNEKL